MMIRDRRLNLGLLISVIVHVVLFFLLSRSAGAASRRFEDINEVTLLDQSYRPEVAKVVAKGSVWSEMPPAPVSSGPSLPDISTPAIDINAKLDRSQAKIELDRYDHEEKIGDVIRVGNRENGTMKSTEEILAEKPISLAKNLPRGAGTEGGYGIGNQGGIGTPAAAPALKIDKTAPVAKPTSTIGKQVDAQVETKLKTEGTGTQISLAGPIAGREILRKNLPQYPSWCQSRGISGMVKIRIWVNPGGQVREGALVEVSSGYPDLDQAVINAVRSWLFAPLPATVQQEAQWGIITFRFVLG